ncbi:PilZ domain-containing protein [Butyrivibrio sp. Su6]|uniref:PilZ domain-containing protein n=1 Tax=Butyrivibrio sp. Su6 TaxID=1520810 RepID=UPI00089F2168|nr:PilZ domain-containing protein [Butyrivibrio sp. Su6]SEG23915.1 PilZ domain-containing protein [Butyrivibrio sp. Su6]
MEERRKINRVEFKANSVIVDKESLEKYFGEVKNVSPLGMAITVDEKTPSILGNDVIVVAETLIMYADVVREDKEANGKKTIALKARKFTPDVLQYLFEHIAEGVEE